MSKPLVSVCVPVWNREKFLAATLDSVLGQSYTELEVLVLDNASTDFSVDIACAYAARDSRVRVVRNESNIGGMPNYRRLLQLATGDYIKFCNSDDLLSPSVVGRLVDGLENPGVGIAFARQMWVDENGRPQPPWLPEPVATTDGLIRGVDLGNALLAANINMIGCPTATMFRRNELTPSDWCRFGGEYLWVAGDLAAWLSLLAGRNAAYVHSAPAVIRVHKQQETMSNPAIRVLSITDWLTMALRAPVAGYLQDRDLLRIALTNGVRALAAQPDVATPTAWTPTVLRAMRRGAEALELLADPSADLAAVTAVPLDFRRDPDDAPIIDGGDVRWREMPLPALV